MNLKKMGKENIISTNDNTDTNKNLNNSQNIKDNQSVNNKSSNIIDENITKEYE